MSVQKGATSPDRKENIPANVPSSKEHAVTPEEALLKEVVEQSDETARQAAEEIRRKIGQEVRESRPGLRLSPDLRESGASSPQQDASQILENGSTIELPISQNVYREGGKLKFSGHEESNKSFVGTPSIIGLVTSFARIIKEASIRGKNIIFRGANKNAN